MERERETDTTAGDEAALRALLDGAPDERAAATVVERVVPRLAGFLKSRYPGLAAEDAQDVAREALTIALERRALFDPGRETRAATWLHGIAKVRALDFLRKRGRQVPLEAGADRAAEPPAPPSDGPIGKSIREAIEQLPPQQRRAAEAHYLDGRPPRDVDAQYGWRPNTANVYLSHARRALRRHLGEAGGLGHAPPQATHTRGKVSTMSTMSAPTRCRARARVWARRALILGKVA
jgi:RNA polymerase sigma factor (sigma-70 family)